MSELTHDDISALLGVYALDALDDAERALVDAHLPACPKCRAELREHMEVATALGDFGEAAPPGTWDKIAAEISDGASNGPVLPPLDLTAIRDARQTAAPEQSRRPSAARILGVAAAVILAVAFAAMAGVIAAQQGRIDDMETAMEGDSVMLDPDASVVQLAGADGVGYATAVVGDNGRAVLLGTGLEALPDGRAYQLWAVGEDGPVSLGMLGADPHIVPFGMVDDETTVLAITEEPAAGSVAPTSDPMATGEVAI